MVAKANQYRSNKVSPSHRGPIIVKGEIYLNDGAEGSYRRRGFVAASKSVAMAHPSEIQLQTSRSRITDGSANSFLKEDGSAKRKDPGMQIPVNSLI